MSQKNPFKSEEIYGFQTLYREIGYYISRLEHYDRALKFFDEAIRKTPTDVRALIGRSRARAKASQYEGALQDVNKVLNFDSEDLVVLADKALNTYLCCEFEESLIHNCRSLPKRQKPDNFAIGVMQCSDAIENCLGERTGRPLRDHFEIIRKLAWKKSTEAQKPFVPTATGKTKKKIPALKQKLTGDVVLEPIAPKLLMKMGKCVIPESVEVEIVESLHSKKAEEDNVPRLAERFPFKPLQAYTTNIKNFMAEKYLDSMYLDKIFLEKMQTAPGAECPNLKGSMKIQQLAKNCYKTVSYKQQLLRTRRPFYFIKYQEADVSGTLRKRQTVELELQRKTIKKEADSLLNKMIAAYTDKKLKLFLDLVEKLKNFCDSKPKKLIPDKSVYIKEIYDKVCKAFYEVYRLNESQGRFQNHKRIYNLLGLPISREASTDSVINEFKGIFLNYQKEIKKFKKRLENAQAPEEMCWYYHELSRFHLETKQYDFSRIYAKKGIQTAKLINNQHWAFNCVMLIVKSNILQQNKNDSKNELQRAMKYAQILNDPGKISFIESCLEIMEYVELGDASGVRELEMREKKIVQMMASSHMKEEVTHLFKQMAAMPAARRMTVMPGVKTDLNPSTKQSKAARTMSIMPGHRDSPDFTFESKKSKKDASKSDLRGMSFKEYMN